MNPDNQQPQPYQPAPDANGPNDQLFTPRYAAPLQNNQPQPPRTSPTYPWAPTQADQPHPAQPASPISTEHSQAPLRSGNPGMSVSSPASQYGGQMAELPPLVANINPNPAPIPSPAAGVSNTPNGVNPRKPQKSSMKVLLGVIIGVAVLALIGAAILVVMQSSKKNKNTAKAPVAAITYNTDQVKKLVQAKQLNAAAVQKLSKSSTFYSAFRTASQQPVVQTNWDVYYTAKQNDARADQYNMYNVAVDYRSKQYNYNEDDYSNIGLVQTRCVGDKEYLLNAIKGSQATTTWQSASDNTSCKLDSVATRMSDGLNTGGLNTTQSNAFVQQLNQSRVVNVNSLSLVSHNNTPYLQFDVSITPQPETSSIYWGMQNFLQAFQSTGLKASQYPYTYFGSAGEGTHLVYIVDPATMLPAYSVMYSTPAFNASGKPITPASWSHRYVAYTFPSSVKTATLDDHTAIAFTGWLDH